MGILYANAQELLSETNADGIKIRRWNDDYTEIIMKSVGELQSDLNAKLLATVNAHDILLYKLQNGSVVPRTSAEIAVDEYVYTVQHFNVEQFQTDLRSLLATFSSIDLRWEFAALNTFAVNGDFAGMEAYMDLLLENGIATQSDVDKVNIAVTSQGIIL